MARIQSRPIRQAGNPPAPAPNPSGGKPAPFNLNPPFPSVILVAPTGIQSCPIPQPVRRETRPI